jgi:hypothetical protein
MDPSQSLVVVPTHTVHWNQPKKFAKNSSWKGNSKYSSQELYISFHNIGSLPSTLTVLLTS